MWFMCSWCGKDVEGKRAWLGCNPILCETCQEVKDTEETITAHADALKLDRMIEADAFPEK